MTVRCSWGYLVGVTVALSAIWADGLLLKGRAEEPAASKP